MKTRLLFTILLVASSVFALKAQTSGGGAHKYGMIDIASIQGERSGTMMEVSMDIDYGGLSIRRNNDYQVIPLLVNGGDTVRLAPVVFVGKTLHKQQSRFLRLYGEVAYDSPSPYKQIEMPDRLGRSNIKYMASVPFEPWMNGAGIVIEIKENGCCGTLSDDFYRAGIVYKTVPPVVTYTVPEKRAKLRCAEMTAKVRFALDKSVIDPSLYDNRAELDSIYSFTEKIFDDTDCVISGIGLKGYASPEGRYSHNAALAAARTETLKQLLMQKYSLDPAMISVESVPEDWDGLASWLEGSEIAYRNEILAIIAATPDPDARDAKIKALDGGVTYKKLLNEVYPSLRRTDYVIEYEVVPFTVERGREMIEKAPGHMSLYEMYKVAESYPAGSPQFRKALVTAFAYYPDDPVANSNMAALSLANGDLAAAKRYMAKCEGYDFAKNNLGIIYALEGRYQDAERSFREAAGAGMKQAQTNLDNMYDLGLQERD